MGVEAVHLNQADVKLTGAKSYATMSADKQNKIAKDTTNNKGTGDPLLEEAIATRIYDKMTNGGHNAGLYGYYGGIYGYGWPAYYPGWGGTTVVAHDNAPYPAAYHYYPQDVLQDI